jgi:hypothetical protein
VKTCPRYTCPWKMGVNHSLHRMRLDYGLNETKSALKLTLAHTQVFVLAEWMFKMLLRDGSKDSRDDRLLRG